MGLGRERKLEKGRKRRRENGRVETSEGQEREQ
jgi:hypothetical protein